MVSFDHINAILDPVPHSDPFYYGVNPFVEINWKLHWKLIHIITIRLVFFSLFRSQIRRESIVQKSQERVARYEQWKNSGRSGGSGHYLGFGSRTPRDICRPVDRPLRSASHSALVRRSPNGSDWDYVRPQRRAQSACSTVRRHCCVDTNRSGRSAF